jgi:hypothetical protein
MFSCVTLVEENAMQFGGLIQVFRRNVMLPSSIQKNKPSVEKIGLD